VSKNQANHSEVRDGKSRFEKEVKYLARSCTLRGGGKAGESERKKPSNKKKWETLRGAFTSGRRGETFPPN